VLGVDLGRTCLSMVVLIDKNNKWYEWRLTRGQYLFKSRARQNTKLKAQRYKKNAKLFEELSEGTTTTKYNEQEEKGNNCEVDLISPHLRTRHPRTILNYLVKYLPHA